MEMERGARVGTLNAQILESYLMGVRRFLSDYLLDLCLETGSVVL